MGIRWNQWRRGLLVVCVVLIGSGLRAHAGTIVSIVGTENYPANPISATLTGGFIAGDLQWTHSYSPVPASQIVSATLTIDAIDAESFGQLTVHVGVGPSAPAIGIVTGNDNGTPGPWRPVGDPLAPERTLTLSSSWYPDLADGTFDVYGENVSMGGWGSNRAKLVIETLPEPGAILLLGCGLVGLVRQGRRRH